jgi:hypothetical protein
MKAPFRAKLILAFLITALLFAQFSCQKDSVQPTKTYTIQGLWIGTYSASSLPAQGDLFYSYSIFTDGTILTKSKGWDGKYYYAAGTWALSSTNVFTSTITTFVTPFAGSPVTQFMSGTFSSNGTITDATWKDTDNPNGTYRSGKFSTMQRVN